MRAIILLVLAVAMSGCFPIIYPARYEKPSRQNLADEVPAFIEAGRTTMADVVLALGDPDTVAADESWVAYVSAYREGGGGAAMVLAGGGQVGLLGGARKQMLYRRLLVRFDAEGVVTDAALDLVHCGNNVVFVGDAYGVMPPCFDIANVDLLAEDLAGRLQAAGETNVVVYPRIEWWSPQLPGMLAVSDTALLFIPSREGVTIESAAERILLAELTDAEFVGHTIYLTPEGRARVVLRRGEEEAAAFVVKTVQGDDVGRTREAAELLHERIAAAQGEGGR
jgi:hypothetical protein